MREGWFWAFELPDTHYLTLRHLLDRPEEDPDVVEARSAIMTRALVPAILAQQDELGCWGDPDGFYVQKYSGTVWQLIILAELGADGRDERIKKACHFILEHSQNRESQGFSQHRSAKQGGGRASEVIPCLTGNMTWSLIKLGHLQDPRVQGAISWITRYQRFDDGVKQPPTGWPYDTFEMCWGKHTCHMGVVKTLKALAAIPPDERSRDVQRTIKSGVEYLLQHRVHKRSHDPTKVSKPGWLRFGFPLMYNTDALEILDILTQLGIRDPRMQDAIQAVQSRRDPDGRWRLANTYNGRFLVDIDEKGKPSKWVTLRALTVLKRYN